jgi:amidase
VVAAKATHGLVPSWGSSHVDHTIDAITPLGQTVGAIATLLEVIAGSDDRDAQWVREEPSAGRYSRAGEKPMEGLRIAVVSESVDAEACEPAVLENFWRAVDSLREDGAVVSEQSIPLWIDGAAIFFPYMAHLYSATFRSDGQPGGHLGAYDVHALSAFAQSRQAESSLLADQVKCWLISDRFVQGRFGGLAFARLHNARLALRRMISTTLESFDLLLTPTVNMVAPPLFPPDVPYAEKAILAGSYCFNTAPLNLSGHPALSVPTGTDAGGLPTAIQIIARHFEDELAFSAAFALERQLGPFCP